MGYKNADYSKNYNKDNYYHLACYLPKEMQETIRAHVAEHGYTSTAEFVKKAIETQIARDSRKSLFDLIKNKPTKQ